MIRSGIVMKNIFTLFFGIALLSATLGCGLIDSVQKEVSGTEGNTNSNKTLSDKAVDVAVGDTKIGIQECDEVVEILNEQINDPDENFVTKALKRTVLNQFRDGLKQSLEDNKTDKKAVAEFCADFKKNLVDSLSEANSNKK
jgi:hypothetical protein